MGSDDYGGARYKNPNRRSDRGRSGRRKYVRKPTFRDDFEEWVGALGGAALVDQIASVFDMLRKSEDGIGKVPYIPPLRSKDHLRKTGTALMGDVHGGIQGALDAGALRDYLKGGSGRINNDVYRASKTGQMFLNAMGAYRARSDISKDAEGWLKIMPFLPLLGASMATAGRALSPRDGRGRPKEKPEEFGGWQEKLGWYLRRYGGIALWGLGAAVEAVPWNSIALAANMYKGPNGEGPNWKDDFNRELGFVTGSSPWATSDPDRELALFRDDVVYSIKGGGNGDSGHIRFDKSGNLVDASYASHVCPFPNTSHGVLDALRSQGVEPSGCEFIGFTFPRKRLAGNWPCYEIEPVTAYYSGSGVLGNIPAEDMDRNLVIRSQDGRCFMIRGVHGVDVRRGLETSGRYGNRLGSKYSPLIYDGDKMDRTVLEVLDIMLQTDEE